MAESMANHDPIVNAKPKSNSVGKKKQGKQLISSSSQAKGKRKDDDASDKVEKKKKREAEKETQIKSKQLISVADILMEAAINTSQQFNTSSTNTTSVNTTSVNTSVNMSSINKISVNTSSVNTSSINTTSVNTTSVNMSSFKTSSVNTTSVNTSSINTSSFNTSSVNTSSINTTSVNTSSFNTPSVNMSSDNTSSLNESSINKSSFNMSSVNTSQQHSINTSFDNRSFVDALNMSMDADNTMDDTDYTQSARHGIQQPIPTYASSPIPSRFSCGQCQVLQATIHSIQKEIGTMNQNMHQLHYRLCQVEQYQYQNQSTCMTNYCNTSVNKNASQISNESERQVQVHVPSDPEQDLYNGFTKAQLVHDLPGRSWKSDAKWLLRRMFTPEELKGHSITGHHGSKKSEPSRPPLEDRKKLSVLYDIIMEKYSGRMIPDINTVLADVVKPSAPGMS